uniref:F-box domain-containing protein n=1 Tax=Syphacia muris TaxID=451379 RepID=A0A0N5ASI4_9BILA
MPSLIGFVGSNVNRFHRKLNNETSLLTQKAKKRLAVEKKEYILPDNIWLNIFNYCSPFDLYLWRRVSRNFKRLIDPKFDNILYLDVYKADISAFQDATGQSTEQFYRHRNAQILMSIDVHCSTLVVHQRWTSKDVNRLFLAIRKFAKTVQTVVVDASIMELIAAGLSSMDLNRWYTFQCYLQTFDGGYEEDSVHIQCIPSTITNQFFPKLKEFSLRISGKDYASLTRMLDYQVTKEALFSLSAIQLFRVILRPLPTSNERCTSKRRLSKHLRNFKNWIDVENLRERYCQQYAT